MLKHRDQYGRRVYIYRPGKWNPDKVHFNEIFCGGYALSELVAMETKYTKFFDYFESFHSLNSRTQIAGVTTIADADGFGLKQLRNFTLEHARSAASFVQDSFPLWFRSIHIVNASRIFYIVRILLA